MSLHCSAERGSRCKKTDESNNVTCNSDDGDVSEGPEGGARSGAGAGEDGVHQGDVFVVGPSAGQAQDREEIQAQEEVDLRSNGLFGSQTRRERCQLILVASSSLVLSEAN